MGQGKSFGFLVKRHFSMGIPLGGGHRAGVMEVSLLHSVWLACESTSLTFFCIWHEAFVNSPQHFFKVFKLLQFLTSLSTQKLLSQI